MLSHQELSTPCSTFKAQQASFQLWLPAYRSYLHTAGASLAFASLSRLAAFTTRVMPPLLAPVEDRADTADVQSILQDLQASRLATHSRNENHSAVSVTANAVRISDTSR